MKRFLFIISFAIVALAIIAQGALADDGDCCCDWKSGPGKINVDMISTETYKYLDLPPQKTIEESMIEAFGQEYIDWKNDHNRAMEVFREYNRKK